MTWLFTLWDTPVRLSVESEAMRRHRSSIRPSSPPPWPAKLPPDWLRSMTSSGWPKRRRRITRSSRLPSSSPWVPVILMVRWHRSVKAVMVKVAWMLLANSRFTVWWSTTSLSQW